MHGHTVRSVFFLLLFFSFFFLLVFLSYDKGGGVCGDTYICFFLSFYPMIRGGRGVWRYLYMFPPTYHEGTILTIYMSHWHRTIYFIELLHR